MVGTKGQLMYDDINYAVNRLVGTIVSKDNDTIFIHSLEKSDGGKIVCYYNKTGESRTKSCLLTEISLKPINIGNVNVNGGAYYISRKPMRRDWKQGMRANNIQYYSPTPIAIRKSDVLSSVGLLEAFKNIYPSVEKCLESLMNGEANSIAFCKKLSLARYRGQTNMYYRGKDLVGSFDIDSKALTLNKQSNYLFELIEENLNESFRLNQA